MGIICIAFLFNIWQFTRSSGTGSSQPSTNAFPAPTPSIQFTGTTVSSQKCDQILYPVQEDDTLESIAHQFSITKAELLAANNISLESLRPAIRLRIPICGTTPVGKTTVTTTLTPLLGSTPSTPVNGPTQ
jgi:spore germination protein YaaH